MVFLRGRVDFRYGRRDKPALSFECEVKSTELLLTIPTITVASNDDSPSAASINLTLASHMVDFISTETHSSNL